MPEPTPAPAATAADLTGGATPTPAPAPNGADPAGTGDITGGADPDFYAFLPAEGEGDEPSLRDWAKASDIKDIAGLAKIARDNMKALRESGRLKLPGEGASDAEMAAWRKAIGVPDEPKGYKLPLLKGEDGEPIELNTAKLNAIVAGAHKHGIPAAALEPLLQELVEADAVELASLESDIQARAEAHAKKWGPRQAENVAAVTRALEALGITRDEALAIRAAITPERALDVFAKLGNGLGEDTMVEGGERKQFGVSGAEAQKQLDAKMADRNWVDRAFVPGSAENAEYNRLQNAIGEAANRKAAAEAAL